MNTFRAAGICAGTGAVAISCDCCPRSDGTASKANPAKAKQYILDATVRIAISLAFCLRRLDASHSTLLKPRGSEKLQQVPRLVPWAAPCPRFFLPGRSLRYTAHNVFPLRSDGVQLPPARAPRVESSRSGCLGAFAHRAGVFRRVGGR